VIRSCSRAFANASDRPKIWDYNPGPVLPIPGLGIEFFVIPGSRDTAGTARDCVISPTIWDLTGNMCSIGLSYLQVYCITISG